VVLCLVHRRECIVARSNSLEYISLASNMEKRAEMAVPRAMEAIRLHAPGVDGLRHETIETPSLRAGEVLVEVHAAAITRDELEWPLDRLPAVPSYELSGVVAAAEDGAEVSVDDEVYALTPFDRDGVAAEYAAVTAQLLAPKPASLSHVESAAVPLPALSAWQGLFVHGRLSAGERVLVHGAVGGVGQFATQLGRWRGCHVIASASPDAFQTAGALGAHEVVDGRTPHDAADPGPPTLRARGRPTRPP
jgi:NADPH:quinone reductase-like Zn-dependent oxidoreductase